MSGFAYQKTSAPAKRSADSRYIDGSSSLSAIHRDLKNVDASRLCFEAGPNARTAESPSAFSTYPHTASPHSSAFVLPPIRVTPQKPLDHSPPPKTPGSAYLVEEPIIHRLEVENAQLLAKLARAQSEIEDLKEAAKISAVEAGKLVKDRLRMKAKIDVCEAEIEELQRACELSQRHTAAKDQQYARIIDLSTKLQTKGVADAQQQRTERLDWGRDKSNMQELITNLRSELEKVRGSSTGVRDMATSRRATEGHQTQKMGIRVPRSEQRADLEAEILDLKAANVKLKNAMIELRREHARYTEHIEKLGNVGKSMEMHLRATEDDNQV